MEIPVYLDYNATTPVHPEVYRAMLPFLNKDFGNPSSPYSLGKKAKLALDNARDEVANLIGAHPDEIVFTSGGTESNNMAILGTAFSKKSTGDHIVTSAIEHPAVANVCRFLETHGFQISYLPVDKYGKVDVAQVQNAIRPGTVLITIMHANNEVGTVQDIKQISEIAKAHNIPFHTDAAQSIGKVACNVQNLGVDLLSIAGHKLYAPKGVGALYVKRGTRLSNIMFGATQEQSLRPGTENVVHIVALGTACRIMAQSPTHNVAHLLKMRELLWKGLSEKLGDGIHLNGHPTDRLPNTLSVRFDHLDGNQLASKIADKVMVSTGAACHAGTTQVSSVLAAMGLSEKEAKGTLRVSTGKYSTEEDVLYAVQVIFETIRDHNLSE